MNEWIARTKYIVFAIFLVGSLAAAIYQWWFIWPAQKCDRERNWWDARDHECLTPMPIWRVTGRLPRPAPNPGIPTADQDVSGASDLRSP